MLRLSAVTWRHPTPFNQVEKATKEMGRRTDAGDVIFLFVEVQLHSASLLLWRLGLNLQDKPGLLSIKEALPMEEKLFSKGTIVN